MENLKVRSPCVCEVFPLSFICNILYVDEANHETFIFFFNSSKGQLISKCLFGTYLQFFQRTNNKIEGTKNISKLTDL